MTTLSVNVNKIAWLRNAREGSRPDIVDCARTLIDAGAQGITVHPRPDQRHIRPDDVMRLAELVTPLPDVEYNIEGNPTAGPRPNGYPGFDALVQEARPDQCTLVPDADDQLTSDHGFEFATDDEVERVAELVARYQSWGCRVSLFMDPIEEKIARARTTGADRIELYTGPYADAVAEVGLDDERSRLSIATYAEAARYARQLGLGVNAGHDLNLDNLAAFVSMGDIAEVSIGHALIADALDFGMAETVRRYRQALGQGDQLASRRTE